MQALNGCSEPCDASRLAGALQQREVQNFICGHLDQLVTNAAGDIARVPGAKCVGNRPAPAVGLDAHAPLVAIPVRANGLALVHQVRLKDLQRQRSAATAKGLRHQANKHLTRFSDGLNGQAADLHEAQSASGVAGRWPAPALPGALDLPVQALIKAAAAALHRDA